MYRSSQLGIRKELSSEQRKPITVPRALDILNSVRSDARMVRTRLEYFQSL